MTLSVTTRMATFSALSALLLCQTTAAVAAVIPHDSVVPIAQNAPAFEIIFQPTLKVEDGCVPFPAVDVNGNTSGGLGGGGARNGGCSSSQGQIYARSAIYNGDCAVMYAWYFPKDQVIDSHRHDWESAVVWLSSCATNATVRAVSYSDHGSYTKTTTPPLNGVQAKVRYYTDGFTNHHLGSTSTTGGKQPLIDWDLMPAAARTALTNTDFGDGNVPFKDANFVNNLAKANYR